MSSIEKLQPIMEHSESLSVYDGLAVVEEEVPNRDPRRAKVSEGEMCKVYVNAVGWVDVDTHMRFQGSEDFQQNIHHMLGIKEVKHMEFFHAKLHAV